MLEGALLSTEEITALSKIAPREELLARLAGGMAAPLREFASLLNAIPQNFAYALSALIEAGGAGTETDETTEAVSDDEAPSQDAEEETSESVGSSESGTDDDDSEEESVEDNKIDGNANENEES